MWIIDWLVQRFQRFVTTHETQFQPLLDIIFNVWTRIAQAYQNAVSTGQTISQALANAAQSVAQSFAQTLHNIGLNFTRTEVTTEQFGRRTADTVLDLKISKEEAERKDSLIKSESMTRRELDSGKLETWARIEQAKMEAENHADGLFDQLFPGLAAVQDFVRRTQQVIELFVRDPLGFIASILFEIVLPIVLYRLAEDLARPGVDLGEKPAFGNTSGNVPGLPPGGGGFKNPFVHPLPGARVCGEAFNINTNHGIDLCADKGATVLAAHKARVVKISRNDARLGNFLVLELENQWTLYAFLDDISVNVGDQLQAGAKIARLAQIVEGVKPFLYFELRIDGKYTDPRPYIGA